jgi:hypothetical protein
VDAIPINGFHLNDGGKCGLSNGRSVGHDEACLRSVGVVKGARVVLTEPRVLESVGAVDFVCVRKEEPEVAEVLVWDEFKLRESILVGGRLPKVGDEGFVGGLGRGGRPHGGGRVVEAGWHC